VIPAELPVLPLRDTVLFPNSFMPLAVAREASVRLIDEATTSGRMIGVFTQREASVEEPLRSDLYPIGTATHVHKMFKLPDGSLRLIVQGLARIRLDRITQTRPYLKAAVTLADEESPRRGPSRDRRPAAQHQEQLSSRSSRCRRCCPTTCRRSPRTSPIPASSPISSPPAWPPSARR
jgi:ATP-dependent Lon protease